LSSSDLILSDIENKQYNRCAMDQEPVFFKYEEYFKSFSVKKSLLRHLSEEHDRVERGQKCAVCGLIVTNINVYCDHRREAHGIDIKQSERSFDSLEGKISNSELLYNNWNFWH